MTKSEVANLLMEKTGLGRQESIEAVQVFIECMTKALEEGDKVLVKLEVGRKSSRRSMINEEF